MNFYDAEKILLDNINIINTEIISIDNAFNRILAEDLIVDKNVPEFNRSPLDGYCFDYKSTIGANENNPKIFDIIETVPCGSVALKKVEDNKTIKVLTGAKLPIGANAVIRYEDVEVENDKIKLYNELKENENVILIGEDVKKGEKLLDKGSVIDIGAIGILASIGKKEVKVYKELNIGFISTGSEVVEVSDNIEDGKIYNSNKYIFDGIFKRNNLKYKYYGIVKDNIEDTKNILKKATNECDIVISTGGVSVGDYDLVSNAINEIGFNILIDRINMKPGMACCIAKNNNKYIFALSGNPMSSVTTFYALCLPAIKKILGFKNFKNEYFKVILKNSFNKKIKNLRFLRGKLSIEDGNAFFTLNLAQGNIVVKSLIDANAMIKVENVEVVKEGMKFDCMMI